MDVFIEVLKHTPVWVWILFVFLMKRGIAALYDRQMTTRRLFTLPVLFLVWGMYSLIQEVMFPYFALAAMGIALLIGFTVGWMLWRSTPRLYSEQNTSFFVRPGTPLTLCFIVATFVSKFALTASLSVWPALYSSVSYNVLFGFVTGLFDGIFWGGSLNLFIPWYRLTKGKKYV